MADDTTTVADPPADVTSLDGDDLRTAIDIYLASRHCTLWGEKFSVWNEDGRARAVDWLENIFHSVFDIALERKEEEGPT